MTARWSFNRRRDKEKIIYEHITWVGPFCLPGFENKDSQNKIPDISGVYLFCFPLAANFVLESAGISKSTKKRIVTHLREYRKGNYNIFDMEAIKNSERVEIWHGWAEAKKEENKEEFIRNKEFYSNAIEKQLSNYRIFVTKIGDLRKRERIEAALMINAYTSKEPWADLAPRWMHLKGRYNDEMPIIIVNECHATIFGLPENIEI